MKFVKHGEVGHVDSRTGRVAVSVVDFCNSDLNGNVPAYIFNSEADEFGLDPWSMIDGVDAHVAGGSWDIWSAFGFGWSTTVGPLFTIYVSAKDAARLQNVNKDK